jgi:DMSO/TMAO reductase YedYZ molybdopterin-dependent catalytic subunit
VGTAAGVRTVATVGQTVRPLGPLSLLAPRRPNLGPQGLPVNRSAAAAGVRRRAADPAYRLVLAGPAGTVLLSPSGAARLAQHMATLPISCVEGQSAAARWTGIRLRNLVALVSGTHGQADAMVESLESQGTSMRGPSWTRTTCATR